MPSDNTDANFLNLPTQWSALKKAAAEDATGDRTHANAWNLLLQYYLPAVRAYLMGCTRDADRTDELVQKFSLQFLGGGFKNAQQEKGPFRHYLKRSLSNLVRQEGARREQFEELSDALNGPAESPEVASFLAEYVRTLLDRSWAALRDAQTSSDTPYYDFLKCVSLNPTLSSEEHAAAVSRPGGETYTAERFRKIVSRARHKFASHLYEQVASGLDDPTPGAVAEELADLKLLSYCSVIVRQQAGAMKVPT